MGGNSKIENQLIAVKLFNWNFTTSKRIIIAGPCSAESKQQVLQTALALCKYGVDAFRAGIWKPRTLPGHFEGIGKRGLPWLKKVKEITSLPVAVEVALPEHVEACLEHQIDILWIGARTTANPFLIQMIADSLKGVNIPIMVKNPISPDIGLWIGAIERLKLAGISKLAAIHRGFYSLNEHTYRNKEIWTIPIELRKRIPDLPIICDPSHICGNRKLLLPVSQRAMDLQFDGLMIESHINPNLALTDKNQQITPEELGVLLRRIKFTKYPKKKKETQLIINVLRRELIEINNQIFELLKKQIKISNKIYCKKFQDIKV